ncbi:MAG: TetR/AcrR family transcriptional regulator, partial [Clostridia bacterium]
ILEVAIELFSQNGYSAVSVREITKHVGIKESALYNHFKTKDDILETIYFVFKAEQSQKDLPPVERLDEILENLAPEQFLKRGFINFQNVVSNPVSAKIWQILMIEQFRDRRAREIILIDIYKRIIDFLEAAFHIMIEKKQLKPMDARLLAYEYQYPIFTMMTEYLLLKFDEKDTTEIETRVEKHIQFFIESVKLQKE